MIDDGKYFLQQNVSGKIVQVFSEMGRLSLYVEGEFYLDAYTLEELVKGYNMMKKRPTIAISENDFFRVEL